MRSTSYYPVLISADVAGTAGFYCRHFRFAPLFQADWYVHLQSTEDASVNLAILQQGHASIPDPQPGPATGLLLNFEVADVVVVDRRLRAEGLVPALSLRVEPFGQRHAIYPGPEGVLIDIITPIPPSAQFAAAYAPGTA